MNRILLSGCLLLTAAAGFSLPGCEVHERDRVVERDHRDYDRHDDYDRDHHNDVRREEIRVDDRR